MTQKELLYIEDAIGHEANIIKICNETINHMQNEKLISFLENELKEHQNTKENLMKVLEENAND